MESTTSLRLRTETGRGDGIGGVVVCEENGGVSIEVRESTLTDGTAWPLAASARPTAYRTERSNTAVAPLASVLISLLQRRLHARARTLRDFGGKLPGRSRELW